MKIELFLKNSLTIEFEARAAAEALAGMTRDDPNQDNNPLIAEYARDLAELEKKAAKLTRWVAALPDPDVKQVFTCRYIDKLSWADIAEATNFSSVQVYRLHKKGVKWLKGNRRLQGPEVRH